MKKLLLLLCGLVLVGSASAQKEKLAKTSAGFPVNYEEDLVGDYLLPDPLKSENGKSITDADTWMRERRPQFVKLIENIEYGKTPPAPSNLHYTVWEKDVTAFGGKATRKQVTVYLTSDTTANKIELLVYTPTRIHGPAPLLLTISFVANKQAVKDSGIRIGYTWTRDGARVRADQPGRAPQYDAEQIIDAGFGYATFYYGDIEPDFKQGYRYGIRGQFLEKGTSVPGEHEWGAIAAWSWGLSRVMDYFEKDRQVDVKRIALQGTSRLGKTVLWTGARDTRFKMVIASCSGEGGAALSKRNYGENLLHITDTSRYYYQFAPAYHSYAANTERLPFDAHIMVALMAPRPLLLQTGDTDYWSDPKGEWLSAIAATPVYRLFTKDVPGGTKQPQAGDTSQLHTLGYYMHAGGHGTIPGDWPLFITYMKKYL